MSAEPFTLHFILIIPYSFLCSMLNVFSEINLFLYFSSNLDFHWWKTTSTFTELSERGDIFFADMVKCQ
jgi:hypothetical protein